MAKINLEISVNDVAKLCGAGYFRAFADESGIYLEEPASGQKAKIADAQKHDEQAIKPRYQICRTPALSDREAPDAPAVSRSDAAREDDKHGPYKGFLLIQCESCGEVKAYCAKYETYSFKCKCGHETVLDNLIPMHMHCKCGKYYKYLTNLTGALAYNNCLTCGSPVDMELNNKANAYVTIGYRRPRE